MDSTKQINSKSVFKLNSGCEIPAIALGTYKMTDQNEVDNAIKAAYDAGYRHIDSAIMYENEAQIGHAIKNGNIPRNELFITTKVPHRQLGYDKVYNFVLQSLKDFQTDYLDLVLIHWPEANSVKERQESWQALEKLVNEGKIKSIGVSNFLIIHLKTILDICKIKPAVNQIEIHPLFIDHETINYCEQQGILLQAYSSFARMDDKLIKNEVLVKLCEKYKKLPTQILVRWVIQHGWIVLPKSSKKERIEENINIDDFQLTEQEIKSLDDLNCGYKICPDPHTITF